MRSCLGALLAAATALVAALPAQATPVAATPEEERALGRVFPEPRASVNYTQFDARVGRPGEFVGGVRLLEQSFPRYLSVSTVADELRNPAAVSVGLDGIPAGTKGDTGDGRPFDVLTVTDRNVPDAGKKYAVLMFAHSLETCGRETAVRAIEDLLRATADPSVTYTDGTGRGGTHTFTAAELLKRVKLYVVSSSPDGWAKGDVTSRYDQYTGGGLNSNRVAWGPGWIFQDKTLAKYGYRTGTEPEGIGPAEFLLSVRRKQLNGRPFAVGLDLHGPLPTGLIISQDHGMTPAELPRVADLADRYKRAMDGVLNRYATTPGSAAYNQAAAGAQAYRDLVRSGSPGLLDPMGGASVGNASGLNATVNTAGDYPLQWTTTGNPFDAIGYDASSTWSGFMAGQLGAMSHTIEANCLQQSPYSPAQMQLFVDNVRAAFRTMLAATAAASDDVPKVDLGGRIGYVYDGHRLNDRRHNPSPVPAGFPGSPLKAQFEQVHYDIANSDYLRDLPQVARQKPVAVRSARLRKTLPRLATLVLPSRQVDPAPLRRWVKAGHNLVLTDSALQMLPKLGIGRPEDVQRSYGYVGYADFDRTQPLAAGLPARARETYDPIALGMPLLMERDGYWRCLPGESPGCASGTQNSAPIWTVPRSVVEAIPGASVAGTADPPRTRRTTREGTSRSRAEVFSIPYGKGRIVALGALLPRPSDALPHAFGLQGYTVTSAAQTVFLRALTWRGPGTQVPVATPAPAARAAGLSPAASLQTGSPAPTGPVSAPDAAGRRFAKAMLVHHRQGVTIANEAVTRTDRPAVRALAHGMVLAQQGEAAQLKRLLSAWPRDAAGHVDHGVRHVMHGMASTAVLCRLQADESYSDGLFARVMSRHHRGALTMARAALRESRDPTVRAIARSIERTQGTELGALARVAKPASAAPFAGLAGL